jgi:hypothetical protein
MPALTQRMKLLLFEITFSGIFILAPYINGVWEVDAEENILT